MVTHDEIEIVQFSVVVLKIDSTQNMTHYDNEYFEEHIKSENVEGVSKVMSHLCNICHKIFKSKANL